MERMINQEFNSLPQRSIYYFLATYAPFHPIASPFAEEAEQRSAYDFILSIYQRLYEDPGLMGFRLLPDDSLNDWQFQKDKPKLVPELRKVIRKLEEFIELLWIISCDGQADNNCLIIDCNRKTLKPSDKKQLERFEILTECTESVCRLQFPCSVKGLQLLARISLQNARPAWQERQKPYLLFSRGVFDPSSSWSTEIFSDMLEQREPFHRLIAYLEEKQFRRIDNKECNHQVSLDYIKCYGKADDELKWAWGERTHSGLEVIYEETRKNQPLITLRIPYYKELLERANEMSPSLKNFILLYNKKCDNCRYCVQTDKTGKRPLAFFVVENRPLCPLYPGFMYRWKSLDDSIVNGIIEMLEFIDHSFKERYVAS